MKKLLFLLLVTPLLGTVNEPLRCEVFSGYRNDRIHWHLQEPGDGGALTYGELYRDVQFWENGLVLRVIHRDLTFFLRGAYGTFGDGTVFQHEPGLSYKPQVATDGWSADGSGYFGYAVNLTADRTYKVIVIPLLGYSAHFESLHRKSPTLPGVFRQVWNGFLLGVGFLAEPGGRLVLNAGYTYHLIHNRVQTKIDTSVLQTIDTSSGGDKGHTGWGQLDFILNPKWRAGVGGQIHYFFTRVVDATIKESNRGNYSEKFKLRWTSFSAWAQLSREF